MRFLSGCRGRRLNQNCLVSFIIFMFIAIVLDLLGIVDNDSKVIISNDTRFRMGLVTVKRFQ